MSGFGNIRKFIHGDSSRALDREFLNTIYDASVANRLKGGGFVQKTEPNIAREADIFTVQNKSGAVRNQYEILKPGNHLLAADEASMKQRQVFEASTPAADQPFCVLQAAASVDGFAPATFSGCTLVQVDVQDSSHQFAYPTTSFTQLTSGTAGPASILWKESGTGTKWAFIRIGQAIPDAVDLARIRWNPASKEVTTTPTWKLIDILYTSNSSVFDASNPSPTTGNLLLNVGGTYEIVLTLQVQFAEPSSGSTYRFTDTLSASDIEFTYRYTRERQRFAFYLTEEGNSTEPTSGEIETFDLYANNEGLSESSGSGGDVIQPHIVQATFAMMFTLDEDDAPAEVQLWCESTFAGTAQNIVTHVHGYAIRYDAFLPTTITPFTAPPP